MLTLSSPFIAVVLLVPALAFAVLGWVGEAPGEWGTGALIAWIAVVCALLAGAILQAGGVAVVAICPIVAFCAVMIGGPPGLVVAALASLSLYLGAGVVAVPAWFPGALAAIPAVIALRHYFG